ncbi:MAG: hypothetical protein ACRCX2_20290 [Paraclostridium sp.]
MKDFKEIPPHINNHGGYHSHGVINQDVHHHHSHNARYYCNHNLNNPHLKHAKIEAVYNHKTGKVELIQGE